jgi:hypothetical protein
MRSSMAWWPLVATALLGCGTEPGIANEPLAGSTHPPSGEPPARVSRADNPEARGPNRSIALARPAPVGGAWLRCYSSFLARSDPEADVSRLAASCGKVNGMQRLRARESGELAAGGRREHALQARAGECYRVFAVGAPSIGDLDVEVYAPDGRRVAFDTGDDRWPIVEPDRPFCAFDDGRHRVNVHAQRGAGRYALEVWRLSNQPRE